MTASMFFALYAAVFISPHIGPRAGAVMWALSMIASICFLGES